MPHEIPHIATEQTPEHEHCRYFLLNFNAD